MIVILTRGLGLGLWCLAPHFSYIVVVSFIGGGNIYLNGIQTHNVSGTDYFD